MKLFAKTKRDLFLKGIGRRLVDTGAFGPHQFLLYEKEQKFYLKLKKPEISLPILEGYGEKAEEKAFDDDTQLGVDFKKSQFAEEAVRAFSLIKKIAEGEGKKNLVSKVNAEIISIGDRANKFRPGYALEGIMYGINFSAVPFAYNHAEGTIERKLETAEAVIRSKDFISNLEENILALYSNIGIEYAQRIAEKLSGQYIKPAENFNGEYSCEESTGRVLRITRALYSQRKDLFDGMEKFLDKELLARAKYPDSRIAKTGEGIVVIPKDEKKIVMINGEEREIATQPA